MITDVSLKMADDGILVFRAKKDGVRRRLGVKWDDKECKSLGILLEHFGRSIQKFAAEDAQ